MTEKFSTPYEEIGGEKPLRELVDKFYDIMETAPEFRLIRNLHPDDLQTSRDKLFMFLSGWSGGPSLYMNAYGHPRLRARHMPFPIGETERDQWLACMSQAMDEVKLEKQLRENIYRQFERMADFMRNKQE